MCTIAVLIEVVRGAPLVLAANRDEIYARPTRPPEVLRDSPRVVGGRDVLSGGTWLALRADARFAAVTNQRALVTPPPGLVSRGLAVIDVVASNDSDATVAALDATRYASMNLVWGDSRGAKVAYTRREDDTVDTLPLGPGIHVLCNDRIGSDGFPRGERLAAALEPCRDAPLADVIARLPALLGDHTRVALADTPPSHLPPELGRELTATCIHSEHYGTRSATILALAGDRVLAYLHADGPPCVTPFRDLRGLL
jgi:uncharacterized protein with NRDE domain